MNVKYDYTKVHKLFAKTPDVKLSEITGIPVGAIRLYARKNGLKKAYETDRGGWSRKDTKYLIDNYRKSTPYDCAQYLGKSKSAVILKWMRLKKEGIVV